MPELPEVETVVRSLEPVVAGKIIKELSIHWHRTISGEPKLFKTTVQGRRVVRLYRRGKYICFSLDDGSNLTIHLRMTGKLVFQTQGNEANHIRAEILFEDGTRLYFVDMRKFGRLKHWPKDSVLLPGLGPDPLESSPVLATLKKLKSIRPIKTILLDQTVLAGIGNIYADEALFLSAIHPSTPLVNVPVQKIKKLSEAIPKILHAAIKNQGTTLSDYRPPEKKEGHNQHYLKVYGRESSPCYKCASPIKRVKINNRSSHFCPQCQAAN